MSTVKSITWNVRGGEVKVKAGVVTHKIDWTENGKKRKKKII